jgi:osmoprotectant transport system substrate-binding protein
VIRRAAALVLLLAAALLVACGGGDDGPSGEPTAAPKGPVIRLGTKNFSEQFILGELYRQALVGKGFRVDLKEDVGSTEIIDAALTIGKLDMYPEYVGVLLSEIAGQKRRPRSAREAYTRAQRFVRSRDQRLLDATPFSNSNALAVKPATARRLGLRSIGDLDDAPGRVEIAAPPEFRTRFEGLLGLRELYGLRNIDVVPTAIGEQYDALDDGLVDVAAVFTTDGQLNAGSYELLDDEKGLFSYQNVAPVVSRKMLDAAPGLADALDAVSAKLTTRAMQAMNAAVDLRGERPAAVARRFLREHGLV